MASCGVCKAPSPPYKCPRCGMRYCSVECFKTHGQDCTEAFYETQVIENRAQPEPEDGEKALRAVRDYVDGIEEDKRDMELLGLAEADLLQETDLTEEQLERFKAMLENSPWELGYECWTPWWVVVDDTASIPRRVLVIDSSNPELPEVIKSPVVPKVVNPLLGYMVSEALLAYVVALRSLDGESSGLAAEVLRLCPNLPGVSSSVGYACVGDIVSRMEQGVRGGIALGIWDTAMVLFNEEFPQRCLSHLIRVFDGNTKVVKRLEYFLGWISATNSAKLAQEFNDKLAEFQSI